MGDLADKAWVVLGCTPSLETYKGSVDVMADGLIEKVRNKRSMMLYVVA